MVCKGDVVTWFKSLKSYKRIDVMCTLLNMNLPFELRFLGTCLEDLGKRDFHDFRKPESKANNPSDISALDIQCISDKNGRTKLAVYISLLGSCSFECAKGLYKILTNVEEINNILKSSVVLNPDDETLEELLLLYTLALNHPAFTFEQKHSLGPIFSKLQEENHRLSALKISRSVVGTSGLDTMNDKVPLQHYQSCPSPEQGNLHFTNTSHCTPLSTAGEQLLNIPEQLNTVGYLRFNYTTPLMAAAPWSQVVLSTNDPHASPLVSRTSSPCQSNSPSRAGSPGKHKPASIVTNFQRPPPRSEPSDPLRDTHLVNLKKYTIDQLYRMCDDDLRELGLPIGVIQQFRSIFNKAQPANGLTNITDGVQKKPDTMTSESINELSMMRQYGNADVSGLTPAPGVMYAMAPPPVLCTGTPPCLACVIGSRGPHNKSLHPHFLDQMKGLCLDAESSFHTSNSSTSDSASDHSPPDTPSLSTATDRGPPNKDVVIPCEMWNNLGGGEEQQRIDGNDDRRIGVHTHPPPGGRARGLGRSSRSTPPGIQTVSRGRGPNNNTNRRRDINSSNVINGGQEERKVYSGNESSAPYPFSPTASSHYIPPGHFMRSAAYPFGPGSFVRTATFPFPHPNGDIVYQFPPPPPPPQPFLASGPGPGPTPLTFSPITAPPPKISCYNCGSPNHLPSDCQDPTMEEVTKQGQYRIDYNPNPKSGECSSGNQDKLQ